MRTTGSGTGAARAVPVNLIVAVVVAGATFGLVQLVVDGPTATAGPPPSPAPAASSQTTTAPSTPATPLVRSVKELTEGTVVAPQGLPGAYVIAGGAPLYIGAKTAPSAAAAKAAPAALFDDLAQRPADGTVVRVEKQLFLFAGGAPLPLTDLKAVGATKRRVYDVHAGVVKRIGDKGAFKYTSQYPADGTVLRAGPDGDYYVVESGVAAPTAATDDAVVVDPEAVRRAGGGGKWNRLKKT